jgi:hypothetical protein
MFQRQAGHFSIVGAVIFTIVPSQHSPLGCHDFIDIPFHENGFIMSVRMKIIEQHRNHFKGLADRCFQPRGVFLYFLYFFELEIPMGIIIIGFSDASMPPAFNILIIMEVPDRGRPETMVMNGFILRYLLSMALFFYGRLLS